MLDIDTWVTNGIATVLCGDHQFFHPVAKAVAICPRCNKATPIDNLLSEDRARRKSWFI